jgi:hypothetical protein
LPRSNTGNAPVPSSFRATVRAESSTASGQAALAPAAQVEAPPSGASTSPLRVAARAIVSHGPIPAEKTRQTLPLLVAAHPSLCDYRTEILIANILQSL